MSSKTARSSISRASSSGRPHPSYTLRFSRPMVRVAADASFPESRWVPPAPGNRASSISGNPIMPSSAMTRRSQASVSSAPPPSAYPRMAAMTGFGIRSSPACTSIHRRTRRWFSGDRSRIIDTSAPAQNALSVPVITTARTSGSWPRPSTTTRKSSMTSRSTAFTGGRSNRTTATPPARSTDRYLGGRFPSIIPGPPPPGGRRSRPASGRGARRGPRPCARRGAGPGG